MRRSYTILYVDDDPDDLAIITEAFENHTEHLQVIHAHHGGEALQLLRHMREIGKSPCLVILDINMPIMGGKETLRAIKEDPALRDLKVVMFSTSSNPADLKFAEQWDAGYLVKPTRFNDLKDLVGAFVEHCMLEV